MQFRFEEIAVDEEGSSSREDEDKDEEMAVEDERIVGIPSSLKLVLEKIPLEFSKRYGKLPTSIYVRRCYLELYDIVTGMMLENNQKLPAILFTGIPGIGKSMFLIYFLCRYSEDVRFVDKRFAFEFHSGRYNYYVPFGPAGQYICYSDSPESKCPCLDILVVADIAEPTPPWIHAKWTLIFSSPNPLRYKEFMKGPHSCTFTLPTWSQEELSLVDRNVEIWYDRFVQCGGVPRTVFWDRTFANPMDYLLQAFEEKGAIVAEYFFKNGFGNIDTEKSYSLLHINPPVLLDGSISYMSRPVHTFASDFVFQNLKSNYTSALVAQAASWFNAGGGLASEKLGAASAGHLFEKICLWLVPLSGSTIQPTALGQREDVGWFGGEMKLPLMKSLDYNWKDLKNLEEGFLYQPRISNLESGDAFCLVRHDDGLLTLVILQVTVGEKHPVKANGLKEIVRAFPEPTRSLIARKVIIFVTPLDGKLNTVQALHSQKRKVLSASNIPREVRDFEQWVYRHAIIV